MKHDLSRVPTGSVDDRYDDIDEETEEEFVRDLLVAHPALNEAEARWLWQERARCASQVHAQQRGFHTS